GQRLGVPRWNQPDRRGSFARAFSGRDHSDDAEADDARLAADRLAVQLRSRHDRENDCELPRTNRPIANARLRKFATQKPREIPKIIMAKIQLPFAIFGLPFNERATPRRQPQDRATL